MHKYAHEHTREYTSKMYTTETYKCTHTNIQIKHKIEKYMYIHINIGLLINTHTYKHKLAYKY